MSTLMKPLMRHTSHPGCTMFCLCEQSCIYEYKCTFLKLRAIWIHKGWDLTKIPSKKACWQNNKNIDIKIKVIIALYLFPHRLTACALTFLCRWSVTELCSWRPKAVTHKYKTLEITVTSLKFYTQLVLEILYVRKLQCTQKFFCKSKVFLSRANVIVN